MPNRYLRPGAGVPPGAFEQAVSRRPPHTRSRHLRQALAAVANYNSGSLGLERVVSSLLDWRSAQPVEFRKRCSAIWPDLHAEMVDLARNRFVACLDRTDEPPTLPQALTWVNAVAGELNGFADWACTDARRFPRCIHPRARHRVLQRLEDWNTGNHQPMGTSTGAAIGRQGRLDWDRAWLASMFRRIDEQGGRGAVCTTFAYCAAHVLTRNRPHGPRVEIVSFPRGTGSHVYVLVGRNGGLTDQGCLPEDWDAVVVDAWAAALGHPCIYASRQAFRFQGMTQGLELVMQRPATRPNRSRGRRRRRAQRPDAAVAGSGRQLAQ